MKDTCQHEIMLDQDCRRCEEEEALALKWFKPLREAAEFMLSQRNDTQDCPLSCDSESPCEWCQAKTVLAQIRQL